MEKIITIGLDIAKSVFQVHGIGASGEIIVRRQLRRRQLLTFFERLDPCLIGMEACATAHHWARQIAALGHEVRLMPPRYVKPYVKRNKNDAADAQAICEPLTGLATFSASAASQSSHDIHIALRYSPCRHEKSLPSIRVHLKVNGFKAIRSKLNGLGLLRFDHRNSHLAKEHVAHFPKIGPVTILSKIHSSLFN